MTDAYSNMMEGDKADLHDLEIDRLEREAECLKRGRFQLKLTERQMWFIKCAIEASVVILPLRPEMLSPQTFEEDYGISQLAMQKEIECLRMVVNHSLQYPVK